MSANLSKRLQALEALRFPCPATESAQIDAIMVQVLAAVEAIPAAMGDARTPEQRLEDALLSDAQSAELDALLGALPSMGLTPALRHSLMGSA